MTLHLHARMTLLVVLMSIRVTPLFLKSHDFDKKQTTKTSLSRQLTSPRDNHNILFSCIFDWSPQLRGKSRRKENAATPPKTETRERERESEGGKESPRSTSASRFKKASLQENPNHQEREETIIIKKGGPSPAYPKRKRSNYPYRATTDPLEFVFGCPSLLLHLQHH